MNGKCFETAGATRPKYRGAFAAVIVLAAVMAAALAASAIAGVSSSRSAQPWTVTPVASGLDSPRGLAITSSGQLLVGEAGHGGDVCVSAGPLGQDCTGTTSLIAKVNTATGATAPLVSGLYSTSVTLEGVTGVDGIATAAGKQVGAMTGYPQHYDGWTCAGQPADCPAVLAAARGQAGKLIEFTDAGTWSPVADIGASDYQLTVTDPSLSDPLDGPNANPYGVLPLAAGTWVADAGSNMLDFVPNGGKPIVASHVPNPAQRGFPGDAVPTCVAMIRGNLYAADLAGRLWKRNGSYTPTELPLTGTDGKPLLHHVTGCVSDGLEHIYLVDMWGTPGPPIPAGPGSTAGTGSVVEFSRKTPPVVIAQGLDFPNGITLAKDGSLYVTVGSTCTAKGTPFPYCAKGGSIVRLRSS